MSDWQRLSVREGRRAAQPLSEGFSEHGTKALLFWLRKVLGSDQFTKTADQRQLAVSVALACEIPLMHESYRSNPDSIIMAVSTDDDLMVDVLDAVLAKASLSTTDLRNLKSTLADAHSSWTVASTGASLQRRVDPTASAAFSRVAAPEDAASEELVEAWNALYGVRPNYSDAWDHAIKAMEAALAPLVSPSDTSATLGKIISQVRQGAKGLRFALGDTEALAATIGMVWPNPDRHGGGVSRPPTESETAGVVHLAVTVLRWCRDGLITRT